ncbi:Uncharacterised protein [Bifidobacterium adolescentis]|uniref:Uncharacterized protein n=1 Tax=Bifidobacterium adolescentis TaxID=1680 RepID=A0A174B8F3_BIFAD|nr:hypothetical protein B0070_1679 [Bifidobacterium adolescentis]CCY19662.1 unknown [Bifidobacterium adolescentis CAG:119]CUN96040.1 Uncharacterised protein [Bifidobacterium adolescentis]CUO22239.1 Uncharacterised protein [Bifidobacterium adolescentis]
MQSGERHRDSKRLSKLQDGWGDLAVPTTCILQLLDF